MIILFKTYSTKSGEWEDVAWEEINVPREHYHIDYRLGLIRKVQND